ncbi:putative Multidrug Resistance Associated Protein (MRP) [Monocercomonoides exilis]|uniref:putative Multidrug Resistance Associated Protein (MRP) n=1 Tax=Monocercomonoides exilis TaxID=2049356 RepID=UPI00355A1F85|nr:putative Multidrug Resistance Associated Protein (MRP) [Monocercomonoides exilis]|eukprot:MONOS_12306.1-p1 / transcript=MONOS_12306.1 / gene=MONOS_12306 / organism=Monocercomonoides_exilis_PA203 / gene_product=Multidrug Resistance Associated Protein (MRP) / transcript_product=Multidrug Resistance Associated Protein (MRP) / location=Mono_scaffold00673:14551-21447(+) / protein_length=2255 / sequence_SO=supercontig / SO=protein_coding / is_pseudo=false
MREDIRSVSEDIDEMRDGEKRTRKKEDLGFVHGERGEEEYKRPKNRESQSAWFLNVLFCFFYPFVCRVKPVTEKDIPWLSEEDKCREKAKQLVAKWDKRWGEYEMELERYRRERGASGKKKTKKPSAPSLMKLMLLDMPSSRLVLAIVLLGLHTASHILQPTMMGLVLEAVAEKEEDGSRAFPVASGVLLIVLPFVHGLFDAWAQRNLQHYAISMRGALSYALMERALKAKRHTGLNEKRTERGRERGGNEMEGAGAGTGGYRGSVASILSVDLRNMSELFPLLPSIVWMPAQLVVPLVFVVRGFGWVTWVGVAVMGVCVCVFGGMSVAMERGMRSYLRMNDGRVKGIGEVVKGMRTIKMGGLERRMSEAVGRVRAAQAVEIGRATGWQQAAQAVMSAVPGLVNGATIGVLLGQGGVDGRWFAVRVMPILGYQAQMTEPATEMGEWAQAAGLVWAGERRVERWLAEEWAEQGEEQRMKEHWRMVVKALIEKEKEKETKKENEGGGEARIDDDADDAGGEMEDEEMREREEIALEMRNGCFVWNEADAEDVDLASLGLRKEMLWEGAELSASTATTSEMRTAAVAAKDEVMDSATCEDGASATGADNAALSPETEQLAGKHSQATAFVPASSLSPPLLSAASDDSASAKSELAPVAIRSTGATAMKTPLFEDECSCQASTDLPFPSVRSRQSVFQLSGMNLRMRRESVAVVVGGVGSGKTALCNALSGQMREVMTKERVKRAVAMELKAMELKAERLCTRERMEEQREKEGERRVVGVGAEDTELHLPLALNGQRSDTENRGVCLECGEDVERGVDAEGVPVSSLRADGDVLLCGQNAFIECATVKENIVFGEEEDKDLLRKAVEACCLDAEVELEESEEEEEEEEEESECTEMKRRRRRKKTKKERRQKRHAMIEEVGEGGDNLSGGQKARIQLCRIVYKCLCEVKRKRERREGEGRGREREHKVVVLDDVLCGLDEDIGWKVMAKGIVGVLVDECGVCVVMTTSEWKWAEVADYVGVLAGGQLAGFADVEKWVKETVGAEEMGRRGKEAKGRRAEGEDGRTRRRRRTKAEIELRRRALRERRSMEDVLCGMKEAEAEAEAVRKEGGGCLCEAPCSPAICSANTSEHTFHLRSTDIKSSFHKSSRKENEGEEEFSLNIQETDKGEKKGIVKLEKERKCLKLNINDDEDDADEYRHWNERKGEAEEWNPLFAMTSLEESERAEWGKASGCELCGTERQCDCCELCETAAAEARAEAEAKRRAMLTVAKEKEAKEQEDGAVKEVRPVRVVIGMAEDGMNKPSECDGCTQPSCEGCGVWTNAQENSPMDSAQSVSFLSASPLSNEPLLQPTRRGIGERAVAPMVAGCGGSSIEPNEDEVNSVEVVRCDASDRGCEEGEGKEGEFDGEERMIGRGETGWGAKRIRRKEKSKLITAEEQATGRVPAGLYWKYLRTLFPIGWLCVFGAVIVVSEGMGVFGESWLGVIGEEDQAGGLGQLGMGQKGWVYGGAIVVQLVLSVVRALMAGMGERRSSVEVHWRLMKSIVGGRMSFFERTPAGRVLNRASGDMSMVDEMLVSVGVAVAGCWIGVVGQVVVVAVPSVWFLWIGVPTLGVFFGVLVLYGRAARNLQRVESIGRSAVLTLSEVCSDGEEEEGGNEGERRERRERRRSRGISSGVVSIGQWERREEWLRRFEKATDEWSMRLLLSGEGRGWTRVTTSLLGAVFMGGVVVIGWWEMSAGLLAVAITASMEFAHLGQTLVERTVDLDARMTALQRILFYAEEMPQEEQGRLGSEGGEMPRQVALAGADCADSREDAGCEKNAGMEMENNEQACSSASGSSESGSRADSVKAPDARDLAQRRKEGKVKGEGEEGGKVLGMEFRDVWMKYRVGQEYVLRGVSFGVEQGKWLGICGRSGSGKSSLVAVLVRLVEIDKRRRGRYEIDGETGFAVQVGRRESAKGKEEKEGGKKKNRTKARSNLKRKSILESDNVAEEEEDDEEDDDNDDEWNRGSVFLDGMNIAEEALEELRRKVCVIPQDAPLMGGTLRENVDVFGQKSDEEIWRALEEVGLKEIVAERMGWGLDTIVNGALAESRIGAEESASVKAPSSFLSSSSSSSNEAADGYRASMESAISEGEGGEGGGRGRVCKLSGGEKQLVWLCRAVLGEERVVVVDEGTSRMGGEEEGRVVEAMGRVLRRRGCTVVVIAHHLDTIAECDEIAVVEDGEIIERGRPAALLAKKESALNMLLDSRDRVLGLMAGGG